MHTHSTYATAWAARGEPVPCVLTMAADEFGGEIPVGPFAIIGDDSIGRGIVETLRGSRSPAVLMRNHGVFTIGPTARAAVKAAVMCEDVARTVHIARQLGAPDPDRAGGRRPALRALPERLRPALTACRRSTDRPTPVVLTSPAPEARMTTSPALPSEIWFLTGSQALYGPETLDQVAEQSRVDLRRGSTPLRELPVRVVWKPVLLDADSIQPADAGGQQRRSSASA